MLPADKTKVGEGRPIPMTQRLQAVLEMRRLDPTGEEMGPDAYVFGNEVGERVKSIRTAWENCRRRAGVRGLHFHDLRRTLSSFENSRLAGSIVAERTALDSTPS